MKARGSLGTLGGRSTPLGTVACLLEDKMVRAVTTIAVVLATATSLASGATPGQAAQALGPVSNSDVIAMTAAGLSDGVIITAIQQATTTAFDLSPDALIGLKEAGVTDRVIQAMQGLAKGGQSRVPNDPAASLERPTPAQPSSEPCRIFITEEDPPSRLYVVVRKEVQAGKKFYGSHDDNLMFELAGQADRAGADAIIKFHEWRAPSMWSWAAAKAGGMAVKWTPEGKATISALKGQCWNPKAKDRD